MIVWEIDSKRTILLFLFRKKMKLTVSALFLSEEIHNAILKQFVVELCIFVAE